MCVWRNYDEKLWSETGYGYVKNEELCDSHVWFYSSWIYEYAWWVTG